MNKVFNKIGKFAVKNQSGIALGVGLALSIIGAVFTAKAAVKSKELIEEEKFKEDIPPEEKLPVKETVKVCWKEWIPSVLCYSFSFAAILYGKRVDAKKLAAASAAYQFVDKFSRDYAEKVKEQIGEEKEKQIREDIRKEKEGFEDKVFTSEDLMLYEGDSYYLDAYLNKIFVSNNLKIEDAINVFNDRLNCDGEASMNDFYDLLYDRTPCAINRQLCCEIGNYLGFTAEKGLIEAAYDDGHAIVNGKRLPVTKLSFVVKKSGQDIFPKEIM